MKNVQGKRILSAVMSIVILLSTIIAVIPTASALSFSGSFLYYVNYDGKTATIVECYETEETEIEVPSTIDGYTVTGIDEWAFSNHSWETIEITIPDTVTSIASSAFGYCFGLTSINVDPANTEYTSEDGVLFTKDKTVLVVYPAGKKDEIYSIPDGVTTIESDSFLYNRNLTSIVIPDSVTIIGDEAFEGSKLLTSVSIPAGVEYIGGWAFALCTSLESVELSEGLAYIGEYAFYDCACLTSIEIPYGVTDINDYAFSECSSLTNVVIPDSVTGIGGSAFMLCESLTEINVPESVMNIGAWAFAGCSSAVSINIPDGVTRIADGVFYNCESLESVNIPEGVTKIGTNAFAGCLTLESINIPKSVVRIGEYAFTSCESLTAIEVSPSNQYYTSENGVLFNKAKTELISCPGAMEGEYVVPSGVTSIDGNAFSDCHNLTSVVIPDSVESIGEWAFSNCYSLESINIPEGITGLANGIFYYCYSLTDIDNLLEGVTSIGSVAFCGCVSLTDITIPEGVTSVGREAFAYCYSLVGINLPASLTSIGWHAFEDCVLLISVDVSPANTFYTSVDGVLFNKDATNLILYPAGKEDAVYSVPDSVATIGNGAFSYAGNLTAVEIPESVTSIGSDVFANCLGLTDIDVSPLNECYTSEDGVLFDKDKTELIAYPAGRAEAVYSVPDSVESIGNGAFGTCILLEGISIPESLTSIGTGAFESCALLTDVYYAGSEEAWEAIDIGDENDCLIYADIHFNADGPQEISGDADGDGMVTMKDILSIRKYLLALVYDDYINITASDVDCNGEVNMKDVLIIRKYIVGLVDELPFAE